MTLAKLKSLLKATTGASNDLDVAVADALDVPHRSYSSSVDACRALIDEVLPTAHWHIGRAADGVSMYATLTEGEREVESEGPTVPLVLLKVVVMSYAEQQR